jgi:hypothetical protein
MAARLTEPAHRNLVPGKYRGVAVAHVDSSLTSPRWPGISLAEAYRRTGSW